MAALRRSLGQPPDFAGEARVVGAYGKTVTDPGELEVARGLGLDATREGQSAVVAVRIA